MANYSSDIAAAAAATDGRETRQLSGRKANIIVCRAII